jgi:hypothetical protein
MIKWFLVSFLIYLITSCTGRDTLPEGILSKKQMQEVLWDMTRAGEFLNGFVLSKDSSIDRAGLSHAWYDKIFELNKTSIEQFYRSYAYYEKKPVLLKEILDSISRKEVSTGNYGQAPRSNVDTTGKNTVTPSIDTRIRTVDSINKRRILKRSLQAQ